MHDLTRGSITGHLIRLALPIAIGMLFQTLYVLIDLYFVARLGDAAVAGVSAAGNLQFVVMALTQVLAVGTMALIAQAAGRGDAADVNRVFNQSVLLAFACALITLLGGYAGSAAYMRAFAADPHAAVAGAEYLYAFLPGLALQFALVAMGAALRGTGIAKPGMVVQMLTVMLNALLAPVLIAGWLTGRPLGVFGAGLASTLSIAFGVVLMVGYFIRLETYVGFDRTRLRMCVDTWRRILRIGLPAGGEFALMFVYLGVIYALTARVGTDAQAGFGIGSRVMQAIFLPAMAIAFAAAPIAGQNLGAGRIARVRRTFATAALLGSAVMVVLTLLCRSRPEWLVQGFAADPGVAAVAADFLAIVAWNFVASGLVFTCSGLFQALGNTLPALVSSATRLAIFIVPACWLASRPRIDLHQLWYLSVATATVQAIVSLWLVRLQLRRLDDAVAGAAAVQSAA